MRILIKGGVWKNTEDEILKAAVMKYGLNQWARISSLLVRKSAKQCKSRWYEWLDPAIKKTEWTREEDEKLLHLAKLLPTQWRTIAPIVGRTPAQCLERYEKLLDMAVGKEDRYDAADDPRRLRPGEIDPNPESKPARPDAVDMDEDEKEMLAEARARLANTRGKKAKRKAREKQMEEARRLASLQKKRELKAAGIELRGKDKRKRGIDYNAEVAFERKPAPGFYDTGGEQATTKELQQEFRPVTIEEMEGKRRKDVEEAMIKQDLKRQKTDNDAVQVAARANEAHNAALARRGKMMLPAPQISEAELEAIARLGEGGGGMEEALAAGAGGDATRQLLGQYQTPARFATPMRTPRTAVGGQDAIMHAAQQLARMNNMQTPLMGGEGPEINPEEFAGVTPKPQVAATPNPLAAAMTPGRAGSGGLPGPTPLRTGSGGGLAIAGVSATPSIAGTPMRTVGHPGATPMRTPIRDALGLNEMDPSVLDSVRGTKGAFRGELRAGLQGLPAPQNEYAFAAPELPEELEAGAGDQIEEDAADAKARRLREAEAAAAAEEARKSAALRRKLPRPVSLEQLPATRPLNELQSLPYAARAEDALAGELLALLQHDAAKYPIGKPSHKKKGARKGDTGAVGVEGPPLAQYEVLELAAAAQLVAAEAATVKTAMGHDAVDASEYNDAWSAVNADVVWLPSKGVYGRAASATNSERLDSARADFESVRAEMEREAQRAAKLEKKVGLVCGGLSARDAKLREQLAELAESAGTAGVELACFKALAEAERRSAPERMEALMAAVDRQREREGELQQRYKLLSRERDDLREALIAVVTANGVAA